MLTEQKNKIFNKDETIEIGQQFKDEIQLLLKSRHGFLIPDNLEQKYKVNYKDYEYMCNFINTENYEFALYENSEYFYAFFKNYKELKTQITK